jgi:dTMP kinase
MRGKFISFEGGEGSGKSTHAARLAERLKSHGIDTVLTREPGGSPGAEVIRHILLSGIAKPLGTETEALLFAAARDDHVRVTIRPALEAGKWVVCDRFIDSTRVYQGMLGKVDPKLIRGLERITVGDSVPDLTFVMDVPAKLGLARASRRRRKGESDRFESEALTFHETLNESFVALAKAQPERCVIIDGRNAKDFAADDIWRTVIARLQPQGMRPIPERVSP